MRTKLVQWAYATSDNANQFGFKAGCWCVETQQDNRPPMAVSGHATREEAIKVAGELRLPWSPLFLRFNADVRDNYADLYAPDVLALAKTLGGAS